MHTIASPARLAVIVTTVLAFCATLLVGGSAEAAGRKADGLTGYAFDARCAPTQEQMDAWLTSSPFWGVGIYMGGSTASCQTSATDPGQPHLDATWVSRQRSAGWRILPIWVGPQASCSAYGDLIDPDPAGEYAAADARGRAEATAAVARAQELGIKKRTTLWYDLEGGFDVADDDCRRSALRFLSGWTEALHDLRYRSGVYSSVSAGIHVLDNADALSPGSYEMPDQVWYAWDNNRADVDIPSRWVRRDSWEGDRVHKYQLHTDATYGGVPLTIDRNYLELDGGSQPPRRTLGCGRADLDLRSYPRLRPGDRGDRVEVLQCLLRKHARYRGRIDGRYDAEVARAVRGFQRRNGVKATGKPEPATWIALLALGPRPLLKVGSSGDAVLRLERALRAYGLRSVKPVGVVTDRTTNAVARYQRRVGVDATGVVTKETWRALQGGAL